MIKLSDYIAKFLVDKGIKTVFGIIGGASLHLIHSFNETDGITCINPPHEQSCGFAADGYSRNSGVFGVAIGTSGPGGTNMLTAVSCAYYDSIPMLCLLGQVSTFRSRDNVNKSVRQLGFQECDGVNIFQSVTNYSVEIKNAEDIRYELEKAIYLMNNGRKGPVALFVPDNIQRELIDEKNLKGFEPGDVRDDYLGILDSKISSLKKLIQKSKRPVIILGSGITSSGAQTEVRLLIDKLNFPVLTTFGMRFFLPSGHRLNYGVFGTHGLRHSNFILQNSDLVISLGSSLNTHHTGNPKEFARGAKKVIVDIDKSEIDKFSYWGVNIDLSIISDLKAFLKEFADQMTSELIPDIAEWNKYVARISDKYSLSYESNSKSVNPYNLIDKLSDKLFKEGDNIFSDTGNVLIWLMQAVNVKDNQKIIHDFNFTAMGYSLPASIGSYFSDQSKNHFCLIGDGSLMMVLQDLATIKKHNIPIKIFVFNNRGYAMIQQTQDQWMNSEYVASTSKDLSFPDFVGVAESFGLKAISINNDSEIEDKVNFIKSFDGPLLIDVNIDPSERVKFQAKFGRPIEDQEPLLSDEEFKSNMLVKSLRSK